MQNRQLAAFTEMVDAVNAGDAKRYASVYAPDATIVIHGSSRLEGRNAIEEYEVGLLRQFPGTRFGFYAIWQHGSSAVVHYAVNTPAAGGPATGHEGLLFYRFDPSGLIAEERRYLDSLTPMAQAGMFGLPARPLPALPVERRTCTAGESPAEQANVTAVKANLQALDARNEAAFLAGLTDDVVLDDLTRPRPFAGRAEARTWFGQWTAAVPDARTEIAWTLGAGDSVLVETVVRGTLEKRFGPLRPSDRAFAIHRAAIARVRNGRIGRLSLFMNGRELAEAVGQWPLMKAE